MYLTLFGTPSGFVARTYGRPPFEVDDRWIDSRNEVSLDDGEWAVMVSRRTCAQGLLTWIGLYRPAHEIHVSRGGQYGAGLWLLNQAAPGPEAFALLTAVADEVARLALVHGKFTRTFDAFEPEIRWPDALGATVRKALRPAAQAGVGSGDKPMLLMDASAPEDAAACGVLIDLAQGGAGLGGYQRMLITALPRVARQVMAITHATATTPAKWQQGVEAVVEAATKRGRDELQAALADAESVRQTMATMREQLLADHAKAMSEQSAQLTAEFNRQLQKAKTHIAQLEPALQQARQHLESARRGARRFEEANVQLRLLVQDLQADASIGFEATHAARIEQHAQLEQALKVRVSALSTDVAQRDHKLSRLEQVNQNQRLELERARQQSQDDARRHALETADLRRSLEASREQLTAELRHAQAELAAAKRSIDELQQDATLLRQQLLAAESAPPASSAQQLPALAFNDAEDHERPRRSASARRAPRAAFPMRVVLAASAAVLAVGAVWMTWPVGPVQQDSAVRTSAGHVPAAPAPAAAAGAECLAGWQPGLASASPSITAPANQLPASIADAVQQAACSPRRLATCLEFDQRELARQLDAIIPPPGAARWAFRVSLPQGCQLSADSIWEWSAQGLVAQRVYADPPAATRKEGGSPAGGSDKQSKTSGNKASQTKPDDAKSAAAAASRSGAGTTATAGRSNAPGGGAAHGASKSEAKPPAGDRPPALSAPVVSGGGGGESGP